ncbi:hypothetical protein Daesc_006417 [Daldinia eschscholtzii]|uniref:Uncharacterized protein n=1 Tax=Daldinia eschscholtzii TaxID=292717 RepID=A0AAX6MI97_9PEZI
MSHRNTPLAQADADFRRALEEAQIIHEAGSRIDKHIAVMVATSTAKFQIFPGELEKIIASRASKASGRVSPTEQFLRNKAINSKRKACQEELARKRMAATASRPKNNSDDDDGETEIPDAVVRHRPQVTTYKAAPIVIAEEEGKEKRSRIPRPRPRPLTPYPGDKEKATRHTNISEQFRKLKFLVGGDEKKDKKRNGGKRV